MTFQPKRILHVGNISNLAYNNAKILRDGGHICDVLCYDFYHFAGSPEWQELTTSSVRKDDFGHDYWPDLWVIAPEQRVRPSWFFQGPMYWALNALLWRRHGTHRQAFLARCAMEYQRFKAIVLRDFYPQFSCWTDERLEQEMRRRSLSAVERRVLRTGSELDRLTEHVVATVVRFNGEDAASTVGGPFAPDYLETFMALDANLQYVVSQARQRGISGPLGFESTPDAAAKAPALPKDIKKADIEGWNFLLGLWKRVFDSYDIVVLYSTDVIRGYILGIKHWLAYEHGTIRVIPFEDNSLGRLTRAAYLNAPAVLITNADYITQPRRLEFKDGQKFFLPHTYDQTPLEDFVAANPDLRPPTEKVVFIMPSRQDWTTPDPKMAKGNDRVIRAARILRDAGHDNFEVRFIEWGIDVDASQDLIASLGVQTNFVWVPPMAKYDLWRSYLTSHAVIDQFLISSISGVSYDALGLGCRVITFDDGTANKTFFDEAPPILSCETVEQVADRMLQVILDPADKSAIGPAGRDWVSRRHGAGRIFEIEQQAFDRVLSL